MEEKLPQHCIALISFIREPSSVVQRKEKIPCIDKWMHVEVRTTVHRQGAASWGGLNKTIVKKVNKFEQRLRKGQNNANC